jgi:hypothetical protein
MHVLRLTIVVSSQFCLQNPIWCSRRVLRKNEFCRSHTKFFADVPTLPLRNTPLEPTTISYPMINTTKLAIFIKQHQPG